MSLIRASLFEAAVQQGNAYFISRFTTLNNNDVFELSITAPMGAPETIGLALEIMTNGQVTVLVFRDTTLNVVPGGTIFGLRNQNGASSKTANTVVRRNPTVDADGLEIVQKLLSAGQGNTGGPSDATSTIVLEAEDKTSLVRLISGAANLTINFVLQVTEEQ